VTAVDSLLSVSPAPLTVVAADAERAYGQTNPVFTVTYSGFVNGETNEVLSGTLAFACEAQTNSPVGPYAIAPSGLSGANYSLTFSNGTLTVRPYALTVTAEDKSKTYGQADPDGRSATAGLSTGKPMMF